MRAAAMQLNSTPDRDRNIAAADRLVRAAAAAGAELVVLPEKWPVLGTPEQTAAGAEPLDGARADLGARRARELGIDLVAGSIAERGRAPSAAATRACTSARTARTARATARCTCSTWRSAGASYRESEHEAPGDERSSSELANGDGLGLTICYDLRFPELFRDLAVRGAASSPSRPRSPCRRRATTGRCCCAPGRSRTSASSSPPTRSASPRRACRTGGRSMIVDPWGIVLAPRRTARRSSSPTSTSTRSAGSARKLPSLANRRPGGLPLADARRAREARRRSTSAG